MAPSNLTKSILDNSYFCETVYIMATASTVRQSEDLSSSEAVWKVLTMYSTSDEERALLLEPDRKTTQHTRNVTSSAAGGGSNGSTLHLQHDSIVNRGGVWYLALIVPNLSTLLVATDVTIVTTLSASIAFDLASLSIISWLGTVYLIAMVAVQPISGQLTDRFGRRGGLLFSLIAFAAGNLLCGVASNTTAIITGRVIAGLGGGTASAVTAYITNDLVPLSQRGLWGGLGGTMWSVGAGLGGIVGGIINDLVGWRWAFLCLAPLSIMLAVAAYFAVPDYDIELNGREPKIDLLGIFVLVLTLVSLILGLNLIDDGTVRRSSTICLIFAGVMLICLIFVELRSDHPVIPLRLLANRSVLGSCLSSFFIAALGDVLLFNIPPFIQVQGYSTSEVGLQLLGEPIGGAVGSMLAGVLIKKLKTYVMVLPLFGLIALGAPVGFYLSSLETDKWVTICCVFAVGIGCGGVVTCIMTSVVAVADPHLQAPITGMMFAFRQSGSSIGLALSSVLFRWLVVRIYGGGNDAIITKCSQHGHTTAGRPKICYIYGQALHYVFLSAVILAVLALTSSTMIRGASLDRDHTTAQLKRKSSNSTFVKKSDEN